MSAAGRQEAASGLWDKPRKVTVEFEADSVRVVDLYGTPTDDTVYGVVDMGVGCGGHTPYGPTLVMAEPGVDLAAFRGALTRGVVADR